MKFTEHTVNYFSTKIINMECIRLLFFRSTLDYLVKHTLFNILFGFHVFKQIKIRNDTY